MTKRECAAKYVAGNWRVRKRLPRITQLAVELGYLSCEYFSE